MVTKTVWIGAFRREFSSQWLNIFRFSTTKGVDQFVWSNGADEQLWISDLNVGHNST
jgi:hypothetical protein